MQDVHGFDTVASHDVLGHLDRLAVTAGRANSHDLQHGQDARYLQQRRLFRGRHAGAMDLHPGDRPMACALQTVEPVPRPLGLRGHLGGVLNSARMNPGDVDLERGLSYWSGDSKAPHDLGTDRDA